MAKKKRIMRAVLPNCVNVDLVAEALASALGSDQVHVATESELGEPRLFVPSGLTELNLLLDREGRGWPCGRTVEIYGGEATCKTGIGYALLAQAQKLGGAAVLYPSEGNYDEWLAEKYGVDLRRLVIGDDATVEGVFESFRKAYKVAGNDSLLVGMIDSIASLCTRDELANDSFDRDRAAQIRAMQISKAMRKVSAELARSKAILFCVNQVREGAPDMRGRPTKPKPPGGRALKFYASIRLRLEMVGRLRRQSKGKKKVIGFRIKLTAEKNRLADPFAEDEIVLLYDGGLMSTKAYAKKKGR